MCILVFDLHGPPSDINLDQYKRQMLWKYTHRPREKWNLFSWVLNVRKVLYYHHIAMLTSVRSASYLLIVYTLLFSSVPDVDSF